MLSNGSASERTDRKGSPAVPSICVIQILQLVKGSEPALSCLQISLGPFSDLSAFEIQSIAQVRTGVSILGQALQVGALDPHTVHPEHLLHRAIQHVVFKSKLAPLHARDPHIAAC